MLNKEKKVLTCLIKKYKDMPYLWKKDHKDYKVKEMRQEGFNILLEIYKKFDEDTTLKTLKKKIENMRSTYMKEFKKVLASKRAGAQGEAVYVPNLWYFKQLSFINYRTRNCQPIADPSDQANSSSDEEIPVIETSISCNKKVEQEDHTYSHTSSSDEDTSCTAESYTGQKKIKRGHNIYLQSSLSDAEASGIATSISDRKKVKREENIYLQNPSSDEETVTLAIPTSSQRKLKITEEPLKRQENILSTAEKLMVKREEEWEVYGRSVGLQLRDLNKRQLTISQKIISDVLFYAKLGKLTENSFIGLGPEHQFV